VGGWSLDIHHHYNFHEGNVRVQQTLWETGNSLKQRNKTSPSTYTRQKIKKNLA
jgi:hypothetical protein